MQSFVVDGKVVSSGRMKTVIIIAVVLGKEQYLAPVAFFSRPVCGSISNREVIFVNNQKKKKNVEHAREQLAK